MADHSSSAGADRRRFARQLAGLGVGAGLASFGGLLQAQGTAPAGDGEPSALERVKARGILTVGVYHELPPFHVKGAGIDVDLARALAESLGVKPSVLAFHAGENVNDDLRNMVWRGHYLGWGPADVLLHVPVDRPLMDANPQVQIFGPYWRESVVIARDLSRIPQLDDLEPLRRQKVAVPGMSLAGWLMLGVDGGSLAGQLITKIDDGVVAAQMLQRGEVGAACGLRSELQATLKGDPRYAITPLPTPRAPRDGWAVGMAVKRGAKDLAQALQAAVNGLGERGELKRLFAAGSLDWQRV
jgi:ABC-type amino acid transport substrate-binding protein